MREKYLAALAGAEVVEAGLERVKEDAVARGAPEERCGRGHASVGPRVGVGDLYRRAAVGEAPVLHAAAVILLAVVLPECQLHLPSVERGRCRLLHDGRLAPGHAHTEPSRALVEAEAHIAAPDQVKARRVAEADIAHFAPRIVDEDTGRRRRLGRADYAALIIAEEAHRARAVEVNGKGLASLKRQLHRGGVELARRGDALRSGFRRIRQSRHGSQQGDDRRAEAMNVKVLHRCYYLIITNYCSSDCQN